MDDREQTPSSPVEFDPFAGPALLLTVPSTESQREIWTAAQLGEDASCAYNESNSLLLRGSLDVDALRQALADLVARHESLRATFSSDGLTMCVLESAPPDLPLVDLTALSPDDRDAAVGRVLDAHVEQPFDLERGPLFRAELLRLSSDLHQLVFTSHHIVVDGWSTGVLVADLARLYSERAAGRSADLPPADAYSDYAREEAERQASAEIEAHEAFWVRQYDGEIPILALPTDRARPALKTFASRRLDVILDLELVQQVKRAGAREGASSFTTFLAAFDVLLHRLTGQDDVVVGIPAAGQAARGRKRLVGHCVNTLPLRSRAEPSEPFRVVLRRAQATMLDAFEHQELTFGALLRKLPIPRDPSRQPLVSVFFNIDAAMSPDALRFDGLDASFRVNPRHFESFDLFINGVDGPSGLTLECQYNTDLFDADTIGRWMGAYERLLRGVIADPGAAVAALPLLGEDERRRISAWNAATAAAFDLHTTVHALFSEQAARTPDAVAVTFRDASLRYAELAGRARALARRLRAHGAGPGERVGLHIERSLDMMVGLFGILEAGAAYVPLDPSYPADRLAYMVDDAGIRVLVTQRSLAARLAAPEILCVEEPVETDLPEGDAGAAAGPEDVAYAIYTSGSTGKPKGVLVPHRAVVNVLHALRQELGVTGEDVVLATTTLSFDIAVTELLLPLVVGARVVLVDRDTAVDGTRLAETLRRERVTFVQATPATWRLLAGAGWDGDERLTAVCGGEAMPRDLAEWLVPRVGALWNAYGPTETTVWSTAWRVPRGVGRILIGRPLANTQVHIWDALGQQVPIGVTGEIYIGGSGVTHGYLHRPELTAERFVPDPMREGARVYRTGDLGRYLADGTLECLGRNDHQVKVRGFRIELGEIEATLASHPQVRHASVVAREVQPGDARLFAYVVARDDAAPQDDELRRHLRRTLPEFMVPQHFVTLAELPLTPSGKVDRNRLPMPDVAKSAREYVPPATPHEERVVALWQEALGVGRLGREDNFFLLGGHSLLAAQMLSRLHREHGIVLPFRAVFEAPTVREFAALLGGPGAGVTPAVVDRIPRRDGGGPARVSLMQERILLLEELEPARRLVYNLPSAFRLQGRLDVAALEESLASIIARHEPLRTRYQRRGDGLFQVIGEPYSVPLAVEDLSALEGPERDRTLRARLREEWIRPFDFTSGRMFRARLFRLAEEEHVFFSVRHNSVWDGWSFDVFRRELSESYTGRVRGTPVTLPDLPITYSDFAEWHARWLAGPEIERQLAYWRTQLSGTKEPVELPLDRPRPLVRSYEGINEWVDIPRAEADALGEVARTCGATLFMVLLAAFNALLHRYTGQKELLVATPVRNRARPEVEDLIGLFTNTLVIRTLVDPKESFAGMLARVRGVVLDAFGHQEVPFELVAKEAPPMRVMFSLQDARHRATALGDVRLTMPQLFSPGAGYEISFWLVEMKDGLHGALNYSTELFDAETMARFIGHFRGLLRSIVANPHAEVGRMSLGGKEVAAARLSQAAAAARLGDRIFEWGSRAPDGIAVLERGRTLSYRALEERVCRAAGWLHATGGSGARVAIAIERPAERALAALATLTAGDVAILPGAGYPWPEVAEGLRASDVRLLWSGPEAAKVLSNDGLTPVPPDLLSSCAASAIGRLADGSAALLACSDHRVDTAIELRESDLVAAIGSAAEALGIGPGTVALATPESGVFECLLPLVAGGRLVVCDAETFADVGRLSELLDERAIDLLVASPSTWRSLCAGGWRGRKELTAVSTAFLPDSVAEPLSRLTGGSWTAYTHGEAWLALERGAGGRNLIGGPLPGAILDVLDDAGAPCPVGVPGELHVSGGRATRPFLRSGDRARVLGDGRLEVLGAAEGSARVGATRVDLNALATTLLSHPSVAESAVGAREDGAGENRLCGFVVTRLGAAFDPVALREHCAERLPPHLVPSTFSRLESLPRTADGDLDRGALALLWPEPKIEVEYVAPRTPTEILVEELVAEVLGRERVGVNDNFFELGGNSFLAAQLASRIEQVLSTRMSIAVILTSATVAQLAERVTSNGGEGISGAGLFRVRAGSGRGGVYIMPDLLGLFGHARRLAPVIDSDVPVHAALLPERGSVPYTFDTLEELAAYVVSRIVSNDPEGPHHLIGYSFGGNLAYEVARQLEDGGHRVGMVAIIDSQASSRLPRTASEVIASARVIAIDGAYLLWHDIRRGRLRRSFDGLVRRVRRRLGLASQTVWLDKFVKGLNIDALPPAYAGVARQHYLAMKAHRERPYGGRVTVIRARRLNIGDTILPDLGWGHVARGGVDLRIVPGDHWNMLDSPAALSNLGTHLTDALLRAERGQAPEACT